MLKTVVNSATVIALSLIGFTASSASAAAPATLLLEGAVHNAGGGPAADGNYNLAFAIYDKQTGGTATWTEGPVSVATSGGRFSVALGAKTPFDVSKLVAMTGHWLGIKVGSDPELPRTAIHATAFSLYAAKAGGLECDGCVGADAVANGSVSALKVNFAYAAAASGIKGGDAKAAQALNCTGCVTVAHMKFDNAVDLGSNPLSAGKITSSGDILAKGSIAASSFTGDGSGLTGIKVPSGDCPIGQVVNGIDNQGKLKCTKVGGDLDGVSGNTLSQHFVDTITGGQNKDVPDFDSNGLLDGITLPDVGIAESFEVSIEVTKAPFVDEKPKDGKPDYDPTDLTVVLFPPLTQPQLPAQRSNMVDNFLGKPKIDGSVYPHYVLHQGTDAGSLTLVKTYPTQTKPVAGDLSTWIGKNPKGLWQLLILDNKDRVDDKGNDVKTDGKLVTWSIKFQTVSGNQVALKGSQFTTGTVWGAYKGHDGDQLGSTLKVGGGLRVGESKIACGKDELGTLSTVGGELKVCVDQGNAYQWLTISNGVAFPSSNLISAEDGRRINAMIGVDHQKWKRCYRLTEDANYIKTSKAAPTNPNAWYGKASTWQSACRLKGPTVTVAKLLDPGGNAALTRVVGGYAGCPWKPQHGHYNHQCGGSFLYSLTNGHKYSRQDHPNSDSVDTGGHWIYNHNNYGPCFGGGHDWCINTPNMNKGYTNLGYAYSCRTVKGSNNNYGGYEDNNCRVDFAGSYNSWRVAELETWVHVDHK